MKRKPALLQVTCLLALLLVGCQEQVQEQTNDFTSISSTSVAIDVSTYGKWTRAIMSIDNDGVATAIGEDSDGRLRVHKLYPDGGAVSRGPYPFRYWAKTAEGNLVGVLASEGQDTVQYIDVETLGTRNVRNVRLADLVQQPSAISLDSGVVVYLKGRPSVGFIRGIGLYDALSNQDREYLFAEPHDQVHIWGRWGNAVVISTRDRIYFPGPGPPNDETVQRVRDQGGRAGEGWKEWIYVVSFDGDLELSMDLPPFHYLRDVLVSPLGIIVIGHAKWISFEGDPMVERYSYEGRREVSYPVTPQLRDGKIQMLTRDDGRPVLVVGQSSIELPDRIIYGCAYIGYFDANTAEEMYSRSDCEAAISFWPLEEVGRYYVYPGYMGWEGVIPRGDIALYQYGDKVASTRGEVRKFAASPNGEYFALLTGDKVETFRLAKD